MLDEPLSQRSWGVLTLGSVTILGLALIWNLYQYNCPTHMLCYTSKTQTSMSEKDVIFQPCAVTALTVAWLTGFMCTIVVRWGNLLCPHCDRRSTLSSVSQITTCIFAASHSHAVHQCNNYIYESNIRGEAQTVHCQWVKYYALSPGYARVLLYAITHYFVAATAVWALWFSILLCYS